MRRIQMSDKIKELARKAGLIAPYGSDREGLRDFDYREFAELIVRECGRVYIQNQQDGVMTLTEDLLYHLGIKK